MGKFVRYLVVVLLFLIVSSGSHKESYDIVVYGGGFAGCAAARNAAALAPASKVLLVVPEPASSLGGLGTVGGQNFADIRYWNNELVTLGSFQNWFAESGQFYNTEAMAAILNRDLAQFSNIDIIYSSDIRGLKKKKNIITELRIFPVIRDDTGVIQWQERQRTLIAKVFIDASDDGRLMGMAQGPLSVGRQDWPKAYLPEDEGESEWSRQQAATLMFKVKGVKTPEVPGKIGDFYFSKDAKGSWGLAGGKETWSRHPQVQMFNEKYSKKGFSIKPINAAQDGHGSDNWWVNMLLVYDVDARAHERDKGSRLYPQETVPDHRSTDKAWVEARDFLLNPDFIETLRLFMVREGGQNYGFSGADLVLDDGGKPQVGEIMYIRESVHGMSWAEGPVQGKENTAYEVTTQETQHAGRTSGDGADRDNYSDRIGLGYYMMDINAYQPQDLKAHGDYVWPVTEWVRKDWLESGGEPTNPVYLPYGMLKVDSIKNLLTPGYAAGCSSFAWAEIRVLPNLAVLGDAAGVAAVRALLFEEWPADYGPEQIEWVQDKLEVLGARLDK